LERKKVCVGVAFNVQILGTTSFFSKRAIIACISLREKVDNTTKQQMTQLQATKGFLDEERKNKVAEKTKKVADE